MKPLLLDIPWYVFLVYYSDPSPQRQPGTHLAAGIHWCERHLHLYWSRQEMFQSYRHSNISVTLYTMHQCFNDIIKMYLGFKVQSSLCHLKHDVAKLQSSLSRYTKCMGSASVAEWLRASYALTMFEATVRGRS